MQVLSQLFESNQPLPLCSHLPMDSTSSSSTDLPFDGPARPVSVQPSAADGVRTRLYRRAISLQGAPLSSEGSTFRSASRSLDINGTGTQEDYSISLRETNRPEIILPHSTTVPPTPLAEHPHDPIRSMSQPADLSQYQPRYRNSRYGKYSSDVTETRFTKREDSREKKSDSLSPLGGTRTSSTKERRTSVPLRMAERAAKRKRANARREEIPRRLMFKIIHMYSWCLHFIFIYNTDGRIQ
ncbi:uncharacterized protein [Centruroides vittatus]|uniref:uncharacterized protein isoform X2 n=1 Tax=Centruroides vittatus TaxID=120091 RepID=UPI003510BDA1